MTVVLCRDTLSGGICIVGRRHRHDEPAARSGHVHLEEFVERARQQVGNHQEHGRNPTRGTQAAGSVPGGRVAQDRTRWLNYDCLTRSRRSSRPEYALRLTATVSGANLSMRAFRVIYLIVMGMGLGLPRNRSVGDDSLPSARARWDHDQMTSQFMRSGGRRAWIGRSISGRKRLRKAGRNGLPWRYPHNHRDWFVFIKPSSACSQPNGTCLWQCRYF
jgi:hypothetical protein